jgi:alpha-ketoglutarate-dependent taurine dioxygenase
MDWSSVPRLRSESLSDLKVRECAAALEDMGLAVLWLGFDDPESLGLLSLASALGSPHPHSAEGEILWDVRPSVSQGQGARSQTSLPFPLHTDCSFEDPTPRFIGLHVVSQDRLGGGLSLLADGRQARQNLDPVYQKVLAQEFVFQVPKEFRKGVSEQRLPILQGDTLRYRREIIDDNQCSDQQREAMDQFEHSLTRCTQNFTLPEGTVLLLDNWRFLHGRTEVLDHRRHLRRVRFHGGLLP